MRAAPPSMHTGDESAAERDLAPAERLFADFVEQHGEGDSVAFEKLCAEHPQFAEDLRGCAADLARVSSLLEGVGRDEPSALHSARAPREIDPGISIESGSGERARGDPSGLMSRLWKSREHSQRYELRGEVARGGMGTVLSVWDRDLRRRLAMK